MYCEQIRDDRQKPLIVTLGDPPVGLNDKKLGRDISSRQLNFSVGLAGYRPYDQVIDTEKYSNTRPFEISQTTNIDESKFKDQKLTFIEIYIYYNETPDNAGLIKYLAKALHTEQAFFCNWHEDIRKVFVQTVGLVRPKFGNITKKEDSYDSMITLGLIDVGKKEEGADWTQFEYYRKALNGDKEVDEKYREKVQAGHQSIVSKIIEDPNHKPESTTGNNDPGANVPGINKKTAPPPAPGKNRGRPGCCNKLFYGLVTPAIGAAGAATAAGTAGVIVYYTSPEVRQWVDRNILKQVVDGIRSNATGEKSSNVRDTQSAGKDKKLQQDKTTATTSSDENIKVDCETSGTSGEQSGSSGTT